jgi:hypothetical protein
MAFMAKAKIKDYYPQLCEGNSWWMNSAAIYATAGFTSYWSYAEYVVKKHLIPIDIIITYTLLDIGTTPDQDPYFKTGSVTNNPGGKESSLNTGIF